MRSLVTLVIVGLLGLFAAASIGYAAYVVSRDTVGSPVTKVKLSPNDLAPVRQRTVSTPKTTTTTRTNRATTQQTTTSEAGDDHGGRGGDDDGSGRGRGGNSGKGGGGGDDD
jgi:hypothetical protein